MKKALLNTEGLHVSYRRGAAGVDAVSNVSFSLSAGQVIAVIGASGAGKSTLALALMGLHDPERVQVSGEILFQGNNLVDCPEKRLDELRGSAIAMIFQDARGSLDPTMKVEKQVIEALRLHKRIDASEAETEARRRLSEAGVNSDVLNRSPYAHQLSSGLCQRVMVAMALAGDPALLIADEPTGSLDLTRQAQIIALLLQQVRERDLGLILITHDLGIATAVGDQLLVIHEGRAVDYGVCRDVLANPGHEQTVSMIKAWRDGSTPKEANGTG